MGELLVLRLVEKDKLFIGLAIAGGTLPNSPERLSTSRVNSSSAVGSEMTVKTCGKYVFVAVRVSNLSF
jgi:hypothetical protein